MIILLIILLLHNGPSDEKTTPYNHDEYSSFRDDDGYVDVFDVEYVEFKIKAGCIRPPSSLESTRL